MSLYWLVHDDRREKPLALVKTSSKKAVVLAGNSQASKGFKDGQPIVTLKEPWCYQLITDKCYHPAIGEWITKLGKVESPEKRLSRTRKSVKLRAKSESLTSCDLLTIDELIGKGVKHDHIAEKFGISPHFVRRRKATKNSKVIPTYESGNAEQLEASYSVLCKREVLELSDV
jgi:hypothetical protein